MATRTRRGRRAPSEAERAERRAAERRLMGEAIEQLRSSEGWQRWLAVRRHFHSYSFHNQLLIAHQRPEATRVAGFRRWLALGYAVRKGERGIRIWAPCPPSAKRVREWEAAGANPSEKPQTFFRMVSVFDRSQVEPLPEFPGGSVPLDPPIEPIRGEGLAHLRAPLGELAASLGYTVVVEPIAGAAQGYCSPRQRRIGVEPVSPRFSANAQLATEVHEVAHAMLRSERRAQDPKLRYGEEEVVVESVAYTVCSALGLDTSGFSVPYATSWSEGGEVERYAELIDRLARRLEDALLPAGRAEEVERAAA